MECLRFLGQKRYADAYLKGEEAEQLDLKNHQATYCTLLADVGGLMNAASAVVSLIASQVSPRVPYRAHAGFDIKQILGTVLADIESFIGRIDERAYRLAAVDGLTLPVPSFPLPFDPYDLGIVLGIGPIDAYEVDLKGTWDKTEVLAIVSVLDFAQAVINYVFSHELVLDELPSDFLLSPEWIGTFLIDNPRLFRFDPAAADRLDGTDERKGVRQGALAALSFLAGRATDSPGISPAHGGFPEAVSASALLAATDAVVKWHDENLDGYPEALEIPALTGALIGNSSFPIPPRIPNLIAEETWDEFFEVAAAFRDNLEATNPKPVSVRELAFLIAENLATIGGPTLFSKSPLSVDVGLNPGAFLGLPKPIGALVPSYFTYTTDGLDSMATVMAIEWEEKGVTGTTRRMFDDSVSPEAADWAHFHYATPFSIGATAVTAVTYPAGILAPEPIAADGLVPTTAVPLLPYIGWQSPSFGNFLATAPFGGTLVPPNNATLNRQVAEVFLDYCIDMERYEFSGCN